MDGAEVAKHNTSKSCYIVLRGNVYDVTSYLEEHPGGAAILLTNAGQDATAEFSKIHSPDVLEFLPEGSNLGPVDTATLAALTPAPRVSAAIDALVQEGEVPHLATCVDTHDFERAARLTMPAPTWSYVSSFANGGHSMQGNLDSWNTITFRPRVLRDITKVSTETSILGQASSLPFYISPMGLLGRSHEHAELALVRGLVRSGAHAVISTVSTRPMEDIATTLRDCVVQEAGGPLPQLHFQLYTRPEQEPTLNYIRRAKAAGYKSLWVTVDTPLLGKRTIDRRHMAQAALAIGSEQQASNLSLGIQSFTTQAQNGALKWEDLKWIKEAWGGPLVLKGIQTAEDAKLAVDCGCEGILLSNHGGRQLHSAPSALSTLVEIRLHCPEVFDKLQVFVDGGLRDGADVLKALCLGAKAVGVGRPFSYALSAYGTAGVERCVDILAEELRTAMALVGITSLDQVHPDLVNASRLLNEAWRPWGNQTIKSRL
ncbi:hypothetical protein PFICI_00653 [Pestalotiopsis fici W106-1]|uniref:Cytochrome b2 n=1 Tax=Pestalotiopsis fici (strain W106-1 / CGMCC3.15140) TaxID=1229662 RepID=W3XLH4_PESFW|nr:uncharacterized protein PFICI_00653 [Pestalotiopsis fici W106-1]ETS86825.1 hypothetical protein PFICI_00653 [Pestalotiopsis fici W106-1]